MTDTIYKEMILDLYRNPLNKKRLSSPTHTVHGDNPMCGDEIEIEVEVGEDDHVIDIGFSGNGCAISQAAASLITEYVKNKSREDIQKITEEKMISMIQIPISYTRKKCVLLGFRTIQQIINNENTD
jgi:nitrogen fixation NifU-like protein